MQGAVDGCLTDPIIAGQLNRPDDNVARLTLDHSHMKARDETLLVIWIVNKHKMRRIEISGRPMRSASHCSNVVFDHEISRINPDKEPLFNSVSDNHHRLRAPLSAGHLAGELHDFAVHRGRAEECPGVH